MKSLSKLAILSFWVLLFSYEAPLYAADPSSVCAQLFRQNQHKLAADCYAQLANNMASAKKLDDLQKKQKGLYRQNAAKAYTKHATQQKAPQEQRYFYELAAVQLRAYLSEKLCVKAYRCQTVKGMLYDAESKVGYATLTLTNSLAETASVEVKGYQFERELSLSGQENLRLRPGEFKIRVNYPKQGSKQIILTLKDGETRLFETATMGKGPPKQGLNRGQLGGVILLATGIAFLGGGIALVWVSKNMERDIEAQYKERFASSFSAASFSNLQGDATRFNGIGFLGLGVGAAAVTGGIIWFVLSNPNKKKTARAPFFRSYRLARPLPNKTPHATLLYSTLPL